MTMESHISLHYNHVVSNVQPAVDYLGLMLKHFSAHFEGFSTLTLTRCTHIWTMWHPVRRLLGCAVQRWTSAVHMFSDFPAESNCKHTAAVSVERTGNKLELKPVSSHIQLYCLLSSLKAKSENLQILHQ